MVTASLLLFCLFSFLTQSADAFRIAPAIFRFPGEVPWGCPRPFPSLASVPGPVSSPVDHLLVGTSRTAVVTPTSSLGAISSLEPSAPSWLGACSLCPLHLPSLNITSVLTDASWNALTDPYVLLVVLLSLVVSTLPSLTVRAFRAILGRATTQQVRAGGAGRGRLSFTPVLVSGIGDGWQGGVPREAWTVVQGCATSPWWSYSWGPS